MDKILIRIAIVIAIAFMASMIGGVAWLLFGDYDDEVKIFCPNCRHEFAIVIP